MARKHRANGGLVLDGSDPRPDPRAQSDFNSAIYDAQQENERNDSTRNENMNPNYRFFGPGPTSDSAVRERLKKAAGGSVTSRGHATMAKLRARHGSDV